MMMKVLMLMLVVVMWDQRMIVHSTVLSGGHAEKICREAEHLEDEKKITSMISCSSTQRHTRNLPGHLSLSFYVQQE
jgi:hypothetical protein